MAEEKELLMKIEPFMINGSRWLLVDLDARIVSVSIHMSKFGCMLHGNCEMKDYKNKVVHTMIAEPLPETKGIWEIVQTHTQPKSANISVLITEEL